MRRLTALLAVVSALGGCAEMPPDRHLMKAVPMVASAPATDGGGVRIGLPSSEKRVAVPGFAGAAAWLNVDHPLTLAELKGRVVVVDFWTSCCINCLQTFPTLKRVEADFKSQPVLVVGVHAPKFDEEKGTDRLRDFLRDNELEHPVAVDADMKIWNAWGITGWPTVAVLDVEGRAIWAAGGEPNAEEIHAVIAAALAEGRAQNKLAKGELRGLKPEKDPGGALRFPSKVFALANGGVAISDTGHHRLVLLDERGQVTDVVGTGLEGRTDGAFGNASFRRPAGIAERNGAIYVADTYNYAIRKIDRATRTVSTVAGTGALGEKPLDASEAPATSTALRSPWDLLDTKDGLVVALAGSHQIALFDPEHGTIRRLAGNGREARVDGSLSDASFAQPSALATDGKELFVLDSETSSVRAIDVKQGSVRTVVGKDLFVFGDVDGDKEKARFEHPLGLAYAAGALWVADTYNAKLKRVDPKTGATTSVLGGRDRTVLSEPSGLAVEKNHLLVADTNHHRVLRFALPLAANAPLEPLALTGLLAPNAVTAVASAPAPVVVDPEVPVASIGPLRIAPGQATAVHVAWNAPAGTAVNTEAPFRVLWAESKGLVRTPNALRAKGGAVSGGFDVTIEPSPSATSAELVGVMDLVICDVVTHRQCVPVKRTVRARFDVASGAGSATASIALPSAR